MNRKEKHPKKRKNDINDKIKSALPSNEAYNRASSHWYWLNCIFVVLPSCIGFRFVHLLWPPFCFFVVWNITCCGMKFRRFEMIKMFLLSERIFWRFSFSIKFHFWCGKYSHSIIICVIFTEFIQFMKISCDFFVVHNFWEWIRTF